MNSYLNSITHFMTRPYHRQAEREQCAHEGTGLVNGSTVLILTIRRFNVFGRVFASLRLCVEVPAQFRRETAPASIQRYPPPDVSRDIQIFAFMNRRLAL